MSTHYKVDLYNDAQLAEHKVVVGDVLTLDVPDGEGNVTTGQHKVTGVEESDAGNHPTTFEHVTKVILTLEKVGEVEEEEGEKAKVEVEGN